MWPGTLAKFQIGETAFHNVTNPAVVGIYSFENDGFPQSLVNPDYKVHIRRSVTVGSYLGDCVGFPPNSVAAEILKEEHFDILKAYIETIPQDKIFFFEDGRRYSTAMMQVLIEIAKGGSRIVTCLGVKPFRVEGPVMLKSFDQSWNAIKELSDEAILYDFESTDLFKKNKYDRVDFTTLKNQALLNKAADMEREFKKIQYPSR